MEGCGGSLSARVRACTHSFPAARRPLSPSTSTHQPPCPLPPSPATTAPWYLSASSASSPRANAITDSSQVPGCSHTAGMPSFFASLSTLRVTGAGVITEREVCSGSGRSESDLIVGCTPNGVSIEGLAGLMGVTGREWAWYQVKTWGWGS